MDPTGPPTEHDFQIPLTPKPCSKSSNLSILQKVCQRKKKKLFCVISLKHIILNLQFSEDNASKPFQKLSHMNGSTLTFLAAYGPWL